MLLFFKIALIWPCFSRLMAASSLSFACATGTETLPDWVNAHARAFGYFGGSARLLLPDNAKIAVIKACLYDPQVNRTYADPRGTDISPSG